MRIVLLIALALLALSGCGSEGAPTSAPPAGAPVQDGPQHVHGLGVDPADDVLYIATHTGLWRAPPGQTRAQRVGTSKQDLMGFTVAGPGRFLASGHPDPASDDPGQLGLIESTDGGRRWSPVSLRGEADFHTLRIAGRRLYGADASSGALLASDDNGRSWEPLRPPGPLVDLAVHPGDADQLVAATEDGLYASRDGGRRWRQVGAQAGLLTWPAEDLLVLVDSRGTVWTSGDGGRGLTQAGSVGGPPAAVARHREEILVALHDGSVQASSDGGRTWRLRIEPTA